MERTDEEKAKEMVQYLRSYAVKRLGHVIITDYPNGVGFSVEYLGGKIEVDFDRTYEGTWSFRNWIRGVQIYFLDGKYHKVRRSVESEKWDESREKIEEKLKKRFDELVQLFENDRRYQKDKSEREQKRRELEISLGKLLEEKGYEYGGVHMNLLGSIEISISNLTVEEAKRVLESLPVRQK